MRLGWVIDLRMCIGCNTCVLACKAEKGTPPGIFYNKVLEKEEGTFPAARRVFIPTRCMNCEDPPCLNICPTGATHRNGQGVVLIDAKKCSGCRACMVACPYDARSIWDGKTTYFQQGLTPYEKEKYAEHVIGATQKCDYCVERIEKGARPYCEQTCLTGALIFGDLDNPLSEVSQALASGRSAFRLKEELGTKPNVYYMA